MKRANWFFIAQRPELYFLQLLYKLDVEHCSSRWRWQHRHNKVLVMSSDYDTFQAWNKKNVAFLCYQLRLHFIVTVPKIIKNQLIFHWVLLKIA